MLDEGWRRPFFQLAALIDMIATSQRDLTALPSQLLALSI